MFPPMWPWVFMQVENHLWVSGMKYLINSYCHYE